MQEREDHLKENDKTLNYNILREIKTRTGCYEKEIKIKKELLLDFLIKIKYPIEEREHQVEVLS